MPLPSPGDLPDLGIGPRSPKLQADSSPTELPENSPINVYYDVNRRVVKLTYSTEAK